MSSKLEIILTAKNETGGAINQVKSALGGLGDVAKTTVVAAGVAAVGAVGAITTAVGVGVGKAADLEQGIADIASVMGVTFDEAKPLGDLIQDLGLDPKLKVDALGASDAIMQLAQSGISMTDILDGAARSTVLLSNATGGDMATSAAVASDAMALFGISAKDMTQAVNGITGVTVASKFGIEDYQYALASAGGVAAAVGVDFDDFNAAITAISPSFASGSDAGTSFKTFLSRLVPQSNAAEDAMRSLGIITEDGKNRFYDASGSLKSMADIAGIMQEATKNLTEEQKNATLATIFGSDAIRAATAIANTGTAGFNDLAASLGKVDAEASAATRMNTFSAQMEILQGVIDGLLTQIGQAFLPILRDLANWATDYVSNNGAMLTGWFEGLAGWIRTTGPLILDWGRVMIGALGELSAWLQGQHTTFGYLTQLWSLLQWAIQAAVQNILNFINDNWPNWVDNLAKWGQAAWQWIVDAFPIAVGKVTELFAGVVKWVIDSLPGWGTALAQWGVKLWQWIVDATPTVLARLGDLWTGIAKWLDDNAGGLGTKFGTWKGKFTTFVDDVKAGWSKIWPDIQKIVGDAATSIGADIDRIIASVTKIDQLLQVQGPKQKEFAVNWATVLTTIVDIIAQAEVYMIDSAANVIATIALLGEALQKASAGDWGGVGDVVQRVNQLGLDMAQGNIDRMAWIQGLFAKEFLQPRANGGPVWAGQSYMVGENGPEKFVPDTNGTIIPNGANTYNTFNVYLSGSGNAGNDVMGTVQTLQALYG